MAGVAGHATLTRPRCGRVALLIGGTPLVIAILAQLLTSAITSQYRCGSGGEFTYRCTWGMAEALANGASIVTFWSLMLAVIAVPAAIVLFIVCWIRDRKARPGQSSESK